MVNNGIILTGVSTTDNKTYVNGFVYTGIDEFGKVIFVGVPYTGIGKPFIIGTVPNLYYKNGIIHNGMIQNESETSLILVKEGLPYTGLGNSNTITESLDNIYYRNGLRFNGVINSLLYQNGILYTGIVEPYQTNLPGTLTLTMKLQSGMIMKDGQIYTGVGDTTIIPNTINGCLYHEGILFTGVVDFITNHLNFPIGTNVKLGFPLTS